MLQHTNTLTNATTCMIFRIADEFILTGDELQLLVRIQAPRPSILSAHSSLHQHKSTKRSDDCWDTTVGAEERLQSVVTIGALLRFAIGANRPCGGLAMFDISEHGLVYQNNSESKVRRCT